MKARISKLGLVLIVTGIIAVVGVCAVSFYEGTVYEAKRDTVLLANEGCCDCWLGLSALKHTNDSDLPQNLEREMDLTAMILSDMTLRHPHLIGPLQSGILHHVRDYHKKYGINYQYAKGLDPNPAEVEKRVDQALAYLDSIHGTNGGIWYSGSEDFYLQQQIDKAKHGE